MLSKSSKKCFDSGVLLNTALPISATQPRGPGDLVRITGPRSLPSCHWAHLQRQLEPKAGYGGRLEQPPNHKQQYPNPCQGLFQPFQEAAFLELGLSRSPSLSIPKQEKRGTALEFNLLQSLPPCLFCIPPVSIVPYSNTESLYSPFSA